MVTLRRRCQRIENLKFESVRAKFVPVPLKLAIWVSTHAQLCLLAIKHRWEVVACANE
jgi:hypothetical protein